MIRAASYALPSLVAALAAVVFAGVVEGLVYAGSLPAAFASTGFAAIYAGPLALALSLAGRGLWAAWRPDRLTARLTEPDGGAPVLAAWLGYLILALALLATATFHGLALLWRMTQSSNVMTLGITGIVSVAAVVLVVLARPAVDALTAGFRRALGPRLRPAAVWLGAGAIVALAAVVSWFVTVRPLLGFLRLSFLVYPALAIAALIAAHLVWARSLRGGRGRAAGAGALLALLAVSIGAAVYARYARPIVMLAVWGEVPAGGAAVDLRFDLHALRDELPLEGVRPRETRREHPSIVLITIDTLRADRTPMYRGPAAMPRLHRFSQRGAVVDWALSPGNVTRRSVPTIVTGLSPYRVRGRVAGWALRLDPRHVLLAERLRAAGYDTAGFHCCVAFFDPIHRLGWIRGLEHLLLKYEAKPLVKAAVAWLEARDSERPYFLWLHIIEPHLWEKLHKRKDNTELTLRQRYDRTLADVDDALAPLLTYLQKHGRLDQTLVAITSDHGEGLGDRGARFHSTNLYNSQVHVPLIVVGDGVEPGRIAEPVSLVDLAPTLLELAGFEPPGMPHMDGVSFAGVLTGQRPAQRDRGESYSVMMEDRSVDTAARALLAGRYKIVTVEGSEPELYDVLADPREREDLADDRPEILRDLLERLERRRRIDQVAPF